MNPQVKIQVGPEKPNSRRKRSNFAKRRNARNRRKRANQQRNRQTNFNQRGNTRGRGRGKPQRRWVPASQRQQRKPAPRRRVLYGSSDRIVSERPQTALLAEQIVSERKDDISDNRILTSSAATGYTNSSSSPIDLSMTIPGEEFLMAVTSTGVSFQLFELHINPGLSQTFPWLSGIASMFDYYVFDDLCVEFRPTASTIANGKVAMSASFNTTENQVINPNPTSWKELMAHKPLITGHPKNAMCWSPTKEQLNLKNHGKLTVRSGSYQGSDPNLNDLCNFWFAIEGISAAVSPGDLYVRYRVRLIGYNPNPPPISGYVNGTGTDGDGVFSGSAEHGRNTPPYFYNEAPNAVYLGRTGQLLVIIRIQAIDEGTFQGVTLTPFRDLKITPISLDIDSLTVGSVIGVYEMVVGEVIPNAYPYFTIATELDAPGDVSCWVRIASYDTNIQNS